MAQVLKLKRTAVQGKVPNTSSLELGELAINTYDGKIYFEKDNGTPSIQTILVTDSTTTGSINLIGAVTASYFKGDGSALTNLPNADVSQVATVTASFDNQSNISVTHNFDTRNILVSVYDTAYAQIIPSSVILTNNNSVDIELSSAQSGFAVVAKGGHIVSGTLVQEVTEVTTVTASFDNQSTISVTHSFGSKNILVSVYDTNDSQIIPSSVVLTNSNTATIGLSSAQSGYVVVAKGGHLVNATGTISYNNLTDIPAGIISGSSGAPAGTISGSSQISTLGFATTGSNTFNGDETISGSLFVSGTTELGGNIVPKTARGATLGTLERPFSEIFVSSGSINIASDTPGDPSTTLTNIDGNILVSAGGMKLVGDASFIATTGSFQYLSGSFTHIGNTNREGNTSLTGSWGLSGSMIISGSLNVTSSLTASGLKYPTTDGTEFSYLQSDGAGNLSFADVTTTYDIIHNGEGTILLAGTPLFVSGAIGANPIVYRADASNPSKMPVTYIAAEDFTTNGRGIVLGEINGVNTTGYPAGTTIYVAEGGGWTSSRPSGSSSIVQVLGIVTKEGSGGKGLVLNPGPTTLPNLQTGYIWVGDNNNQPVTLSTASLATTGSNLFRGTQTHSGSIIPAIDNTYDLGSPTYQWRDIYVSSGSLYIDGTKVLGSTNQELQITTDVGQSIKILEAGSDSIILQSADGDIQLKTSGGGNLLFDPTSGLIDVRGTLQIQDGNKITSSGGNTIQFGNDLGITGSINASGNINGINLTTFSSSVVSTLSNVNSLNAYTSSLNTTFQVTGSKINFQGDVVIYGTQSIINSQNVEISDNILYLAPTASTDNDLGIVGHYNDGTYRHAGIFMDASDGHSWKVFNGLTTETSAQIDTAGNGFQLADFKAGAITGTSFTGTINSTNGVVSGSSQIVSILLPLNTFSSSIETKNNTLGTYTASLESKNSTLETYTGSIDTKNNTLGTYTASLETKNSTLATYTGSVNSQLTSLINATSSYETKGRGIVSGSSQVDVMSTTNISRLATTGSNTFNGNQIISGSLTTTSNATFDGGGIVLSGTASDTIQNSGAPYIYLSGGGSSYTTIQQGASKMRWWQFNGSSWVKTWDIDYTGNATLTGTFTENSSIRYKENVETIKYGLDKVLQLRGVTYNKKDNGVKEMGVIAEEIYEVLPEVVLKNEQGEIDSVSYGRITAVLIEAIKDLKKEIEDLKSNR